MLKLTGYAAALCVLAAAAQASAFHGYTVTNVPAGDRLNVRAGPGTEHHIQAAYPNGTDLSLTGTCTGLMLDDLGGLNAAAKHARMGSRWCEIWHDPKGDGKFVTGWAKGRFLRTH